MRSKTIPCGQSSRPSVPAAPLYREGGTRHSPRPWWRSTSTCYEQAGCFSGATPVIPSSGVPPLGSPRSQSLTGSIAADTRSFRMDGCWSWEVRAPAPSACARRRCSTPQPVPGAARVRWRRADTIQLPRPCPAAKYWLCPDMILRRRWYGRFPRSEPAAAHGGGSQAPRSRYRDPDYPDVFVAPNGKIFLAGFQQTTRYLNTAGTGAWSTVANRIVADRRMGSAVMYGAPGKVLYAGGGDPPTASAEVIDLNQAATAWRSVPGMKHSPRRQLNTTLLADGSVLVTGGTSGPGFNDQSGAVFPAELWNPSNQTWKTMARETRIRTYHSAALLLPDGRVLSTGGGEGWHFVCEAARCPGEIFSRTISVQFQWDRGFTAQHQLCAH